MTFDKKLAYDFLKSITFERLGGSQEESKTVKLICAAIKKAGAVAKVETFGIRTSIKGTAGVEVVAPYKKRYSAKPGARAKSFTNGGKSLPLLWIEDARLLPPEAVKGKAVYGLNLPPDEYLKKLSEPVMSALLNVEDLGYNLKYRNRNCVPKKLRDVPFVSISYETAVEMFKRNASEVKINIQQKERSAISKNVIAVVKGTCASLKEEIVICGHYDSVPGSPGANDNGGGTAIMVSLLKHFVKNPARRTLRFIWFGSEELGLLGSREYVKTHKKDMDRVKMVVNIDGAGRLLHPNSVVVIGHNDIKQYVKSLCKEGKMNHSVSAGTYSSDCLPFTWHEIPSINLTNGTVHNHFVHCKNDALKWSGAEGLAPNGELALEIIQRLGKVTKFPFKRGYNKSISKKLIDFYKKFDIIPGKMPKWCK